MARTPNLAGILSLSILTLSVAVFGADASPESAKAPDDSPELAPGHSYHGDAFNEGPRQAAYLMEGMPAVNFPITTTNELTQQFFTQGVGQLHGFWYFEAERSFRQAAMFDTNCPMAYWGMAMANLNNTDRAREFATLAAKKKSAAGEREQMWIDSLADFYGKTNRSERDRRREYVRALEKIVFEYPNDTEAKAFLAFQIWNNSGKGLPISSAQAVESLLKEIFALQPMHPAHHYRIHLWDGEPEELSVRALPSAACCGQSSPGIAHMWHMPGHTFSKLKRYQEMAWQQEAAVRVDNAQIIRDRLLPDQIHNYAHNSEWLCQTYGRIGRVRDAVALAKNMVEMPHHPRYNTQEKKEDNTIYEKASGTAYHGRRRLTEELIRYELWDELIELANSPYLPPTDIAEEQARRARAVGIAWFEKGRIAEGTNQIAALETAAKVMRSERQAVLEKAERKARAEKKPADAIHKAMLDALKSFENRLQTVERYSSELNAYAALANNQNALAAKQIKEAKEIPKERRAQLQLKLGNQDEAEKLAREAYASSTNQVQVIANYADVLWHGGKTNDAIAVFNVLRARSATLDLQVPVFKRMAPIAEHLALSNDWRVAAPVPDDVGERPDIGSLGPFLWQPQPAPAWTLVNGSGNAVSLEQYRGRPVIVIFYLGYGCVHCIEQLNAFAPMTERFAAAGIELIGVSTDSAEALKKTVEKVADQEKFPFPLVANQELDVFKAYRAYDDFEKMPLHGTFLIDANGLIRWHDIGYDPFTETEFLLGEAQRLLQFEGRSSGTRVSVSPSRSGS